MIKKTALVPLLIFLTGMLALGAEITRTAVVIKTVENMHSAPSDAVDVVAQALLGTNIKVLASEKNAKGEEWFRIETPYTYRGMFNVLGLMGDPKGPVTPLWMIGTSLRLVDEGQKPYASEGTVFKVTSLMANIYVTDDVTKSKPLIVAPIGVKLEVDDCGERWCRVKLPCGTIAWIQKGDGEVVDAAAPQKKLSPDETTALAKRFLGLPYFWGGHSPFGFECAGYVQLLYRLSGYDILADAKDTDLQMTRSGLIKVPAGQEQARDLIFFGRAPGRISHVGMMIGPDEFIHATTHEKPMVQISNLRDPYWQALYQTARRMKE